jgi:hypothetical protein
MVVGTVGVHEMGRQHVGVKAPHADAEMTDGQTVFRRCSAMPHVLRLPLQRGIALGIMLQSLDTCPNSRLCYDRV